jgi:hypothetical protein
MVGEFDAIGDAVTGAMASRTIEPDRGETHGFSNETKCLNCSTPLIGPYCANCGQKAHVHRTIGAFFHDLLHGVLHFDGKTWRTLPLLALRPGDLTRRYIDGERARFVSPMALFLFSVFVMFALLNLTISSDGLSAPRISGDLDRSIAETQQRIAKLEAARKAPLKPGETIADIDSKLAKQRNDLRDIEQLRAIAQSRDARVHLSKEIDWLQGPIQKALQNPDLLIYKVRTSAYKWSWVLIPISAPFLWLLFPFSRRFKMYDHVIFVTYSLAFMNLLVVAAALLYLAKLSAIGGFLLFVPPFHFYRQLKEAYGLTRVGALWRTIALTIFAVFGLVLFAGAMLALGAF